jgi:hypothetical protein
MRLSLAVAFFLAAIVSVDAAPQTNSKKGEAGKFVQMITISGECTKLVHAGRPVSGCKSILVNMNYSTGVSAYWFVTEQTLLSFAGDGSRRVEQGVSIVVQAIDRVILATTDSSKADDATADDAVGFCRFGDPTRKGSMVECIAHTQAGLYEGFFASDGKPPKLEAFQISQ